MSLKAINIEVGKRIMERREAIGVSQAALGRAVMPPITRAAVSNIERGAQNIYLHQLKAFAQALDIPLAVLVGEAVRSPGRLNRLADCPKCGPAFERRYKAFIQEVERAIKRERQKGFRYL